MAATGGDRYSFSLTTFSPSGKLGQIEYALNAVSQGLTSVGLLSSKLIWAGFRVRLIFTIGKEGIVLATERKISTLLIDENDTPTKISLIAPGLGLVYSGMGPDARVLVSKGRKLAQSYWQIHKEWPTALQLVKELASVMQEYTQSG